MTVDEVPSGIFLYPEEESGVDNMLTPVSSRSNAALFEEAQKEILKLMKIEVCLLDLLTDNVSTCYYVVVSHGTHVEFHRHYGKEKQANILHTLFYQNIFHFIKSITASGCSSEANLNLPRAVSI